MSRTRFGRCAAALAVLGLPAAVAACDGGGANGGGGGIGDPCATADDCEPGLVCLDDRCACASPCGAACCGAGEVCDDGVCVEAPDCETVECGGACCAAGEVCSADGCCASARLCGESCCGEDEQCGGPEGDECVACEAPLCGGACCGADERCYSETCCPEDSVCGDTCCGGDEVCEGETCHVDCGEDTRCTGADGAERCCRGDEVCFLGACIVADVDCLFDGDCDIDEHCDEVIEACLPIPVSDCEYHPPIGEFTPEVEWHWATDDAYRQIMMTPAVGNLTDDDGDGAVDLRDVPDVVVVAFAGSNYHTDGVMYVLSGDDGHLHYAVSPQRFRPGGGVAIADVDVDGRPDIVACGTDDELVVLNGDGTTKWSVPAACGSMYSHPLVADLDGDGTVEIVVDYRVFADGAEVCRGSSDVQRIPAAADLDGDGRLEIVGGNRAYAFDRAADPPCALVWTAAEVNDGYPAVADMDLDGDPDVVVVRTSLWILEGSTGEVLWGPYPIPGGGSGGPPTVADFDGDGRPETSTAGLDYYAVYDLECVPGGDPTLCGSGATDGMLWTQPTEDHSSSQTGSSVFDFEGDGAAEVIYADEDFLYIYRGADGAILYSLANSSGTLFEYPLVVDVDNDAQSEIVVIANDYSSHAVTHGVRVIGDGLGNWVRTRRIWNQHAYHVTNVLEDGSIPVHAAAHWTVEGLNVFRQNTQTFGVHNAPNVVPVGFFVDDRRCPAHFRLGVHVANRGSRTVPAGLQVGFYQGDPSAEHELLGSATIDRPILSGGSQLAEMVWDVPAELQDLGRVFHFYAVVDDRSLGAEVAVHECHEDDNASEVLDASCDMM